LTFSQIQSHMNVPLRLLLLFLTTSVLCGVGWSQNFLRDEFDGNTISTNRWEIAVPYTDSQMIATNGLALFQNRGRLLSKSSFANAIEITGKFKLAGSSYDIFAVYFRSDGTIGNPESFQSGVAAEFKYRGSDQGQVGVGNVLVHVPGVSVIATANFPLQMNSWYDFKISDNGTNIGVFIADLNNPIITTTSAARAGNRIGIQNREGAAAGSSISAGSITHVDSVFIREYPTNFAAFSSMEMEFPTEAGKTHQIQVSDDLVTWRSLGPPFTGSGLLFRQTIQTRFDSRSFYRIQTTP